MVRSESTREKRKLSPDERYRMMSRIRKTDTKPELTLRSALHSNGLRGYRVYGRRLPGNPDIVYTRWKVAVFVDGVFWHGRPDYFQFGTKGEYWDKKIGGNMARDERVTRELTELGWTVLRFWDIDVLANPQVAVTTIRDVLRASGRPINPNR